MSRANVCTVTRYNIAYLQELVRNGPAIYLGARYVVRKWRANRLPVQQARGRILAVRMDRRAASDGQSVRRFGLWSKMTTTND